MSLLLLLLFYFFFNDRATTEIYTLSLHDALPIRPRRVCVSQHSPTRRLQATANRSEEHTSELQSPCNLVCRLLLEKKKTYICGCLLRAKERATWRRYCAGYSS